MIDQHQPAEYTDFIAAINDNAVCGRANRRAVGCGNIQAVIDLAATLHAVPRQYCSMQRPAERARKSDGLG